MRLLYILIFMGIINVFSVFAVPTFVDDINATEYWCYEDGNYPGSECIYSSDENLGSAFQMSEIMQVNFSGMNPNVDDAYLNVYAEESEFGAYTAYYCGNGSTTLYNADPEYWCTNELDTVGQTSSNGWYLMYLSQSTNKDLGWVQIKIPQQCLIEGNVSFCIKQNTGAREVKLSYYEPLDIESKSFQLAVNFIIILIPVIGILGSYFIIVSIFTYKVSPKTGLSSLVIFVVSLYFFDAILTKIAINT